MGGIRVSSLSRGPLPRRLTLAVGFRRGDQVGDEHDTHAGFGGYSIVTCLLSPFNCYHPTPTHLPSSIRHPQKVQSFCCSLPATGSGAADSLHAGDVFVRMAQCQVHRGRGLKLPAGKRGSRKQRNYGRRRQKSCSTANLAGVGGVDRGDANGGLHDPSSPDFHADASRLHPTGHVAQLPGRNRVCKIAQLLYFFVVEAMPTVEMAVEMAVEEGMDCAVCLEMCRRRGKQRKQETEEKIKGERNGFRCGE